RIDRRVAERLDGDQRPENGLAADRLDPLRQLAGLSSSARDADARARARALNVHPKPPPTQGHGATVARRLWRSRANSVALGSFLVRGRDRGQLLAERLRIGSGAALEPRAVLSGDEAGERPAVVVRGHRGEAAA